MFDYVEVRGRFAITTGDSLSDQDDDPDVRWCDEGSILFTPLLAEITTTSEETGDVRMRNTSITALIDDQGYLTYLDQPFVRLMDLGSANITPRILRTRAAYRVDFVDVRSGGVAVRFKSFDFHPLPDQVNDLTRMAPVISDRSNAQIIIAGPQGPEGSVGPQGDEAYSTALAEASAESAAASALSASASAILAGELSDNTIAYKSLARVPETLVSGAITRDANGAALSAPVVWPDGTPGDYTAIVVSAAFAGAVDSYRVTYGNPVTKTYTQPTITRDASGAASNTPPIGVS